MRRHYSLFPLVLSFLFLFLDIWRHLGAVNKPMWHASLTRPFSPPSLLHFSRHCQTASCCYWVDWLLFFLRTKSPSVPARLCTFCGAAPIDLRHTTASSPQAEAVVPRRSDSLTVIGFVVEMFSCLRFGVIMRAANEFQWHVAALYVDMNTLLLCQRCHGVSFRLSSSDANGWNSFRLLAWDSGASFVF